jgi:hypothetical protein
MPDRALLGDWSLQVGPTSPISPCMANISKLKQVQERRKVVARHIELYRAKLAALEMQARDLETTERVLTTLDLDSNEVETDAEELMADLAEKLRKAENERESEPVVAANENAGGGKPEGIPTMPEMIYEALRDAKAKGLKGLEPKDITAFIAAKWWPEVKINNVGPIAWRLYKSDKLAKRQSKYRLLDEQAANAAA